MVQFPSEAQSFQSERRANGGDFGQFAGDQGGVTAGRHDGQGGGLESVLEVADEFADEASVAVDGADEHGLLCIATDGAAGFADFDSGKQGGFFVEIIRHGGQAGGDDAAGVFGMLIDDIERDGGAEVDNDGRGAEVVGDGDGVGESVLADGFGAWVMDADAADGGWGELKGLDPEQLFESGLDGRVDGRDDAAEAGVGWWGGSAEPLLDGEEIVEGGPIGGAEVAGAEDSLTASEAEMGVGIADVDEQERWGWRRSMRARGVGASFWRRRSRCVGRAHSGVVMTGLGEGGTPRIERERGMDRGRMETGVRACPFNSSDRL